MPAPTGNRATFGGNGYSDRINIGPTSDSDYWGPSYTNSGGAQSPPVTINSLFYSFSLQVDNLGSLPNISAHNQIIAGFNNLTGTQGSNISTLGAAVWVSPTGVTGSLSNTSFDLGVTTGAATTTREYGTAAYKVGDTLFVVGAYNFGTSTSTANSQIWVYARDRCAVRSRRVARDHTATSLLAAGTVILPAFSALPGRQFGHRELPWHEWSEYRRPEAGHVVGRCRPRSRTVIAHSLGYGGLWFCRLWFAAEKSPAIGPPGNRVERIDPRRHAGHIRFPVTFLLRRSNPESRLTFCPEPPLIPPAPDGAGNPSGASPNISLSLSHFFESRYLMTCNPVTHTKTQAFIPVAAFAAILAALSATAHADTIVSVPIVGSGGSGGSGTSASDMVYAQYQTGGDGWGWAGGAGAVQGNAAVNNSGGSTSSANEALNFNIGSAIDSLNAEYGVGDWEISGSTLSFASSYAKQNNSRFGVGSGDFNIFWVANNTWYQTQAPLPTAEPTPFMPTRPRSC